MTTTFREEVARNKLNFFTTLVEALSATASS